MSIFSLKGTSALVSGSSQGIGRAIGGAIAGAGGKVVWHGLDERPKGMPARAVYLPRDLMGASAPAELVEAAFEAMPSLNALVCNAGGFFDQAFLDATQESFERTINLNVRANFFLIQAFAREMKARRRSGAVVLVTSTNGFQSEDESAAYDTSKGASVMMVRTTAHSLAPLGIRVNGIAPGLIRTPLTRASLAKATGREAHYRKKILLDRIGRAEDCAGPAVFLLSEASSYMTGQILVVDGGLTVGQIGKP